MLVTFTAGARVVFALALATAGAGAVAGDTRWTAIAACALAAVAVALLVLARFGPGGPAVVARRGDGRVSGAAVAVAVGAAAAEATAPAASSAASRSAAGARAGAVLLALVGLAALAAGRGAPPLGALALGAAAWIREPRPEPGPDFSPIVLTAILAFASVALTLLTVGQFTEIDGVAIALAAVTVLSGMARAGLTVIERLRETRSQAMTDDLTGLGNRRHLVDTLHTTIASASEHGTELALLLIDLDGFKELNDTLGHHAGDEVLRQIGPRLKELLRDDDTLARLGGDEFAVILQPGDEASASTAGPAAARRARALLRRRRHPRPHRRERRHRALPRALARRHGPAAARRRRDVPGQAHAHRPRGLPRGRDRHSRQRLALVGELGAALEAGQLVLHYQPKAELRTRRRARRRGARALGAPRARPARPRATSSRWSSRAA